MPPDRRDCLQMRTSDRNGAFVSGIEGHLTHSVCRGWSLIGRVVHFPPASPIGGPFPREAMLRLVWNLQPGDEGGEAGLLKCVESESRCQEFLIGCSG